VRESNVESIKLIRWKRKVKIFCLFTNMFILGLFFFNNARAKFLGGRNSSWCNLNKALIIATA
jgi:hypothetical protein